MADEKKPPASDNNSADNPAEKPEQSVAPGKKAEATKKETKAGSTAEPRATDALSDKEKEAAAAIFKKKMSVEEEKKALDAIITGASTAADKKKAIDELRKLHIADDIIKKKTHETPEGVSEIKQKASAAKKAA